MTANNFTREELELALERIQKGQSRIVDGSRRLSIAAVAEEAGFSAALIHNSYPEFAERIRLILGRPRRVRKDASGEKVDHLNRLVLDLKEQIADLQSDLRKIAVQNLLLSEENRSLRIQLKTLGERSNSKD